MSPQMPFPGANEAFIFPKADSLGAFGRFIAVRKARMEEKSHAPVRLGSAQSTHPVNLGQRDRCRDNPACQLPTLG